MENEKLISLNMAKLYMEANWPNDPLLKQVVWNLLQQLPLVTGGEVQEMFDAVHTESKKTYKVYAVEGTLFLIYIEEGQDSRWEWLDMTEFVPVKQTGANTR